MAEYEHRKTHRGDWEIISSNLRWQLRVFNLAKPDWHGTDARKGNRLFYICAGNGFLRQTETGQKLDLVPGYAYFLPKDISVEQNFFSDLELYALEFQLELLPGLDLFSGNRNLVKYKPSPGFFQLLSSTYTGTPAWENFFQFESLRQQILIQLLREMPTSFSYMDFCRGLIKYARLIDYIRNEATAQTSMEEIAAVQNCSYDKLSRMFRADFRMTLRNMLNAELSMRAKNLLTSTNFSIKEIAERLGFSNEYNFSRFFRRLNACSPTDWRKHPYCAGSELRFGKNI